MTEEKVLTEEQEINQSRAKLASNIAAYVIAANNVQKDVEFITETNRTGISVIAHDRHGNVLSYRVRFDDPLIEDKAKMIGQLIGYEIGGKNNA